MQALIAIFCLLMLILTWFIWPIYRHYRNTNQEREQLEKRYNRLWRSRRDLLVSFHLILNLYFFILNHRATWIGQFLGRTPCTKSTNSAKKSNEWTERWKNCTEISKRCTKEGSISTRSCRCRALRHCVEKSFFGYIENIAPLSEQKFILSSSI